MSLSMSSQCSIFFRRFFFSHLVFVGCLLRQVESTSELQSKNVVTHTTAETKSIVKHDTKHTQHSANSTSVEIGVDGKIHGTFDAGDIIHLTSPHLTSPITSSHQIQPGCFACEIRRLMVDKMPEENKTGHKA